MKVSIITSTFNSAKTLKNTISSVSSQTYKNIEHIFIDGASRDLTLNVISENCDHNYKVISEPDNGIYDALNKGVKMATGDIICILHSDDFFYTNDALEKVVNSFIDKEVTGIYTDLNYVSKKDTSKVRRKWVSGSYFKSKIKYGWMPPHPALFLRTYIAREYTYNIRYKISADYDFFLRIQNDKRIKLLYLPEVLICMRIGGSSNKSIYNILLKMKEDYRVIRTNNIGGLGTLALKNIRKIPQIFN